MNSILLILQFGADKDVFASRFARNAHITFHHLYKCGEEEKSKIIRVLNLWQKNAVFTAEVISPLFDLANPNSELARKVEEQGGRCYVFSAICNNLIPNNDTIFD